MKFSDLAAVPDEDTSDVRVRTAVVKPSVNPLEAYLTLRQQYGPPNSENFDDLKSQWCYHLKVRDAFIEVYDWKLETWSIAVYEKNNDEVAANAIAREFEQLIVQSCSKHSGAIKKAASQASGYVFQNPYLLYYETGEQLLARAVDGKVSDDVNSCLAAFFMFMSAFEGFLNLLYEMYLKRTLRDERIYDRLGREQIDIKVRLAPLYCECFSGDQIDHQASEFKRFHYIANLRNDFIHANLTKPMKRPVVIEDGFTFIVEQDSRDKHGLPRNASDLNASDIVTVKQTIDELIALLLQSMKPRYRREISGVLEYEYFKVSIEEGELIVDWE